MAVSMIPIPAGKAAGCGRRLGRVRCSTTKEEPPPGPRCTRSRCGPTRWRTDTRRNSMTKQRKPILSSAGVAIALLIFATGAVEAQRAPGGPAGPSQFDAFYTLGPDSLPREGVPKGELRGPFKLPSKAYPG